MSNKPSRYGIDAETGYPLCKNGHVRSPENLSGSNCQECRKAYRQSEKCRAYQKAYSQSEKCRAYQKAYSQSEKCRASKKAYRQSEKCRASNKAYSQSEKRKAYKKAHRQSEIVKLSPSYAADILGIKTAQAPPELLEIKILTLKLRRILKCQNQKKPLQQAA